MKDSPKKLAERSAKRKAGSMYEVYDKRSFLPLARKLIVDHRAWLETEDLIAALEANSREPIPSPVLKHLRQRLDGVAKKQRGRKANTECDVSDKRPSSPDPPRDLPGNSYERDFDTKFITCRVVVHSHLALVAGTT